MYQPCIQISFSKNWNSVLFRKKNIASKAPCEIRNYFRLSPWNESSITLKFHSWCKSKIDQFSKSFIWYTTVVVYFTFLSNNFHKVKLVKNIVDCVFSHTFWKYHTKIPSRSKLMGEFRLFVLSKEIVDGCWFKQATLPQSSAFKNNFKYNRVLKFLTFFVTASIVKCLRRRLVMHEVLGSNLTENNTFHQWNCFCFCQMLLILVTLALNAKMKGLWMDFDKGSK